MISYDTVNLYLPSKHLDNYDFESNFIQLTNYSITKNERGYKYVGNLNNLKISGGYFGLWISGSVNKFLNGNNLSNCTYLDIKAFIDTLSDILSLDISPAKVMRLDWAANLAVIHPVNHYIDSLGDKARFKRISESFHSIRYETLEKAFCFYDKLKEISDKKQFIPDQYKGKNILRAEYRITKKLKTHLKQDVRVSDLSTPSFYLRLVKLWEKEYQNIKKVPLMKQDLNINRETTTTQIQNCIYAELLRQKGGKKYIDQHISKFKSRGMTRHSTNRAKNNLYNILLQHSETSDELINEMNECVSKTVKESRSLIP